MTTSRATQFAALTVLVAIASGAIVGTGNIRRRRPFVGRVNELKFLARRTPAARRCGNGTRRLLLTGEDIYLRRYYDAAGEVLPTLDRIEALRNPDGPACGATAASPAARHY